VINVRFEECPLVFCEVVFLQFTKAVESHALQTVHDIPRLFNFVQKMKANPDGNYKKLVHYERGNTMPGVSKEQVELARSVDLLTYLQANEPWELRRSGPNEYRTVTHGSLVISRGLWFWNRGGFGGKSALDYLVKVRGMGFINAVETVLSCRASPMLSALPEEKAKPPPGTHDRAVAGGNDQTVSEASEQSVIRWAGRETSNQPQKTLILPPPIKFSSLMPSYLQKRGISADIISKCISADVLYESRYNGSPVCVFVGHDEHGKARFACMRGINADLKQDCAGSDKRYSFRYPPENVDTVNLAVFEAPVDLLSHVRLFSEFDGYRLSLGGTSDTALMAFLERNSQIKSISLCLDADEAGQETAAKIKNVLAADKRFAHIKVSIDPPEYGKDYNIMLLQAKALEKQQRHHAGHRKEAGFLL